MVFQVVSTVTVVLLVWAPVLLVPDVEFVPDVLLVCAPVLLVNPVLFVPDVSVNLPAKVTFEGHVVESSLSSADASLPCK